MPKFSICDYIFLTCILVGSVNESETRYVSESMTRNNETSTVGLQLNRFSTTEIAIEWVTMETFADNSTITGSKVVLNGDEYAMHVLIYTEFILAYVFVTIKNAWTAIFRI